MVGKRLLGVALPALLLVPLLHTTASGQTTCTYVGNASGTVEFFPETGLLRNAPVASMPHSSYSKTTLQNRRFRRGFVEVALPDFGGFMVSARLVLPESRGTTSFPVPPDTHELSWYPADLVIDTTDYSRPTTPIGTFQTDGNEPPETFVFDVTSLLSQTGCGPLGFRVKLAEDPSYFIYGTLGSAFGRPSSSTPVRVEVDLAPGAPDCGSLLCDNSSPIVVSPTHLPFSAVEGGPNPAARAISITASDGGTLEWTATEVIPWLSLSKLSGSTPATVNAAVDIAGLAPGVHYGNVTIEAAQGGSKVVTVSLTVNSPSVIQVSPSNLPFSAVEGGPNPAARAISITASAGGTLEWAATEGISWLSLSSTSGSTPATVDATVDISDLAPGNYSGNVTIHGGAQGGSIVTVNLTVDLPLQVSPTSLLFSVVEGEPNPAASAISITSGNGSTLAWTATEEIPWLSLSSTSGSTPATVDAAVDISGLAPAAYSGNVTIDGGAQGGSRVVTVTLAVIGTIPGAWADPQGDVSNPQSDAIAGSATISGDVVDLRIQFVAPPFVPDVQSIAWTFDIPSEGNPGVRRFLSLARSPGSYAISGNMGNLDPCAIGHYDNDTRTIRLLVPRNAIGGSDDFHYTIQSTFGGSGGMNERIPNAPDFGSPSGFLVAETGTLEPFAGDWLCGTQPQIHLSPAFHPFSAVEGGPNPASRAISITASAGPLEWIATEEISWLSLSSTSGSTPDTVYADVDISGLAPGVYSENVTLHGVDPLTGEELGSTFATVALVVNPSSGGGPETDLRMTIDKDHLAWTSLPGSTRSDIIWRRIAGHFDGNFFGFSAGDCNYHDPTFAIAYRGLPPAGSVDLWVVRTWPGGVAGTWDEGGNQAAPRTTHLCPSP